MYIWGGECQRASFLFPQNSKPQIPMIETKEPNGESEGRETYYSLLSLPFDNNNRAQEVRPNPKIPLPFLPICTCAYARTLKGPNAFQSQSQLTCSCTIALGCIKVERKRALEKEQKMKAESSLV